MRRALEALVLVMLGGAGCPSRVQDPVTIEPPEESKVIEPWRALLQQAIAPRELGPFPSVDLALPGPFGAPESIEGQIFDVDMGPVWVLPMPAPGSCESPDFPAVKGACAMLREDQRGGPIESWRAERDSAGRPVVEGYRNEAEGAAEFHRCKYDGRGRVIEQLHQWTRVGQGWDVELERWGYDERGGVAFYEKQSTFEMPADLAKAPDITLHVYETTYDTERRPIRVLDFVSYEPGDPTQLDPQTVLEDAQLHLIEIVLFHWDEGHVVRRDSYTDYGHDGGISESYVWQEDFVLWAGSVYERRGRGDYVELYDGHTGRSWEYDFEGGIETSVMYENDFPTERRRFRHADGARRPLTIEQMGAKGLARVETWNWDSSDRVVVERSDGRVTHMLDCAGEPSVDSLVDPQNSPPLPIRL